MYEPSPIRVELGERSYAIHVGPRLLHAAERYLPSTLKPSSAAVVTGTGIEGRYGELARARLESAGLRTILLRIRGNERFKTPSAVLRLWREFVRNGLDRKSLVVAVGGGVVGDVAAFAAGTYMRGIAVMQAPTTLLAQADAGIGGKTGVNLPEGKNLVGVFHQPCAVLMDTATLLTLPDRDYRAGLAEILKHAFLADEDFLATLLDLWSGLMIRDAEMALPLAVRRSAEIKASVVQEDERETGRRAILNFGHTVGHALEAEGGYGTWRHGEAVAMGMVAECLIGEEVGCTPPAVTQEVAHVLYSVGLPVAIPPDLSVEALMVRMRADKKTVGGSLRFALLRKIGVCEYGIAVPEEAVRAGLRRAQELDGSRTLH